MAPTERAEPTPGLLGRSGVVCLGGVNVDIKAYPTATPIPGSSTPGRVRRATGGVAANVAVNLARLGVPTSLYSAVGRDAAGRSVIDSLTQVGVGVEGIITVGDAPTATYVAALDPQGELIVAVADMEVTDRLDEVWAESVAEETRGSGLWVLDTNLPGGTLERLLDLGTAATVIVDPVSAPKARRLDSSLDRIDVLLPNRSEAEALSGVPITDAEDAVRAAQVLIDRGVSAVLLKLGAVGVISATARGTSLCPPVMPMTVRDVTGAGDALAAGYVYGLVHGASDPLQWGLGAASIALESEASTAEGLTSDALESRVHPSQ